MSEFHTFFYGIYKNRFHRELIEVQHPDCLSLISNNNNVNYKEVYEDINYAIRVKDHYLNMIVTVSYDRLFSLKVLDLRNWFVGHISLSSIDTLVNFIIHKDDLEFLISFSKKYNIVFIKYYATLAYYKNRQEILSYLASKNCMPDVELAESWKKRDNIMKEDFICKKNKNKCK